MFKKHKKSKDLNNEETFNQPPQYITSERERCVDRGPAWIRAFCAFIILASHYGILNCGALFYPALEERFQMPISIICWIVTGQFAITFCFAPIYNKILNIIPARIGAVIAILFTSGSFILAAFMNSYIGYFLSYTIVGGVGMGISQVRVIATMAEYFDQYRVLALALCSSGAGFGTLFYAQLGNYMIENYTWRIALISFALVHLNSIPLTIFSRPLEDDPIEEPTVLLPNDPIASNADFGNVGVINNFASFISIGSCQIGLENIGSSMNQIDLPNRILSQGIQAVVEFVKVSSDKSLPTQLIISPVNFLSDPGPRVFERIENVARDYYANVNISDENKILYIPVIFFISDTDTDLKVNIPTAGLLTDSTLTGIDKASLGPTSFADLEQIHPRSSSLIPDAFTSVVIQSYDLKQKSRIVHQVINRAIDKVHEITQKLDAKGAVVTNKPLLVIVDQEDYFLNSKLTNYGLDERLCVLGYSGLGYDTIPEENEADEDDEEGNLSKLPGERDSNLDKQQFNSQINFKHRQSKLTASTHSFVNIRPSKYVYGSRGYIDQITKSGFGLSKGHRLSGAVYKSRDLTMRSSRLSLISVDKPDEAVKLLISKFKNELQEESQELLDKRSKIPCLNPLFITFLLARTFTYVADSILFAHFINFGLSVGLENDEATGLLGYVGIAGMLGRLAIGLIGQFGEKIEIRSIVASSLFILSLHTIVMPFFPSHPALAAYGICYSLFVGPSFAFSNAMAIQIMGNTNMTQNLSYVLLFEAIGYLIGGPIGGAIKELTDSYSNCFMFSGINLMTASFIITTHALLKLTRVQNLLARLPCLNTINNNSNEFMKEPQISELEEINEESREQNELVCLNTNIINEEKLN